VKLRATNLSLAFDREGHEIEEALILCLIAILILAYTIYLLLSLEFHIALDLEKLGFW
jgi:hypothetical protein